MCRLHIVCVEYTQPLRSLSHVHSASLDILEVADASMQLWSWSFTTASTLPTNAIVTPWPPGTTQATWYHAPWPPLFCLVPPTVHSFPPRDDHVSSQGLLLARTQAMRAAQTQANLMSVWPWVLLSTERSGGSLQGAIRLQ